MIKSMFFSKKIVSPVIIFLLCFNLVSASAEGVPEHEPDTSVTISETEISEIVTTVVSEISELPSDSEPGSEPSAIVIPDVDLNIDFSKIDKRELLQYARPLVKVIVQYCLVEFGITLPDEVVELLTDLIIEYLSDPENFDLRTFSDTVCHWLEQQLGINIDEEEFYKLIKWCFKETSDDLEPTEQQTTNDLLLYISCMVAFLCSLSVVRWGNL